MTYFATRSSKDQGQGRGTKTAFSRLNKLGLLHSLHSSVPIMAGCGIVLLGLGQGYEQNRTRTPTPTRSKGGRETGRGSGSPIKRSAGEKLLHVDPCLFGNPKLPVGQPWPSKKYRKANRPKVGTRGGPFPRCRGPNFCKPVGALGRRR